MDFKLFLAVVKRYKRIVIGGTVLAVLLSVLSYGMPGLKGGKPTIIPRGSEVYQGEAELLISQEGFPYGRASDQVTPAKGTTIPSETIGDESYMANLSSVYAALANGTSLQQQVAATARVPLCPATGPCGTVVAAEVADMNTGVPLPLLTLTSSAPTAADAVKLATTTVSVLQRDITRQEAAAGTPVEQRIELQILKSGAPATLTQGHSKSIPILVLFAVVSASIALAFVLNNHSEDPVRSTRRRLDEGLGRDGGVVFADAGNGRLAQSEDSWVQTASGKMQLPGVRRAKSSTGLVDEENAAPHRPTAEASSVTDRRRVWSDRTPPHLLRRSGFKSESRD